MLCAPALAQAINLLITSYLRGGADQEEVSATHRKLYTATPFVDYRTSYEEITGQRLPDLPALPSLLDIPELKLDLALLLAEGDKLIAALE